MITRKMMMQHVQHSKTKIQEIPKRITSKQVILNDILLDLINRVHKFLGYLDISPKYLNRGYTILSVIPTLYLLRIVYGLWQNQNYLQFFLYGLAFLVLVYFTVLNVFYYFLDKNTKADVTQLL